MKKHETKRMRLLTSLILPCDTFADVGCDHGYFTQYVLKNGLCRKAYMTDVSEKSLQKAEKLLAEYVERGFAESVCCNGLESVPVCEQVMIAGMGGEEILSILRGGYLPEKLLLQPMQNTPKVRSFLLESGYSIVRDFTFKDGKYYDAIYARKGISDRKYTARDLIYGYDNLHFPERDFAEKVEEDVNKCRERLSRAGKSVPAVEKRLAELTEIRNEIKGNIQPH